MSQGRSTLHSLWWLVAIARERAIGLTTSQAEVLRVLYDHASLSWIELGERLICETGSPSRLVNTLVEKNLVERKPSTSDRRMVTLLLTPSGRQTAEQVRAIEQGFYAQIATLLESIPLDVVNTALWRFVAGRPAGNALMRRK